MKFIKGVIIVGLLIVSFLLLLKVLLINYYPDFSSYYYGPEAALSGENPYLGGKNFFTPFVYPPFVLLFFAPFTLFTFNIAEKVWTVISIACLIASLILILKMYNQKIFSSLSFFLATLTFVAFPVKFTFGMGQINTVVLVFTILFIYLLNKQKNIQSGIFLGLSILLKLSPVLLTIYLLMLKKWKILITVIFVVSLGFFLTLIIFPIEITRYFITDVLGSLLSGWKGDYYNQALSGFIMRTGATGYIREITKIVLSALVLGVSVFTLRKNVKKISLNINNLSVAILILVSVIVNTFSWQHHYVWLIFPFLATFFVIRKLAYNKVYFVILGISYILVAINLKNPSDFPIILQSHALYGAMLLWIIDIHLLLVRRDEI